MKKFKIVKRTFKPIFGSYLLTLNKLKYIWLFRVLIEDLVIVRLHHVLSVCDSDCHQAWISAVWVVHYFFSSHFWLQQRSHPDADLDWLIFLLRRLYLCNLVWLCKSVWPSGNTDGVLVIIDATRLLFGGDSWTPWTLSLIHVFEISILKIIK